MFHRLAIRACTWLGVWLVVISSREAPAQAAHDHTKDEAAVRQAGEGYAAAIERGDSKALAAYWIADGTYTDETGRTVKVQEMLAKIDGQPSDASLRSRSSTAKVRFVTDDVAIEDGEFNVPPVEGGMPFKGRYTAIWVRDRGRWKLDNLREMPTEPISNLNQLASLGIFAGEWAGDVNNISIRVSAKWDANKKFLHRTITMSSGKASLIGTQQIGWDPLAEQIRSWMFSDDGSFSQGQWNMEGNLWMALATRVLPDGELSQVTQVYKFPDKNTMVWKAIRGSIDGQPTDDFEVVLKRTAAK